MLNEGLGNAGIDPVVGHLIAHPEGAPAQRQLGQVTGAQHDAAALVGDAEQEVGAQPGLNVLEGHVVDLAPPLAAPVRVVHGGEHLLGGGSDVELLDVAAERPRQRERIALGPLARGEPGHGDGVDVLAAQAEAVDGAGGDDERMGGVQSTTDADDDCGQADGPQPLSESGHLNAVCLVAVLGEAGRIVGHEGEAVHRPAQADVGARHSQRLGLNAQGEESARAVRPGGSRGPTQRRTVVLEGALAQPFGPQPLDIDVDDRGSRPIGEALGLPQKFAVLVDEGLAVPGQVRG